MRPSDREPYHFRQVTAARTVEHLQLKSTLAACASCITNSYVCNHLLFATATNSGILPPYYGGASRENRRADSGKSTLIISAVNSPNPSA